MDKILFVIPDFKIGGTNKSLTSLIAKLKDKAKMSVLSLTEFGDLKKDFSNVEILKANKLINYWIADFNKMKFYNKVQAFPIKIIKNISKKLNCDLEKFVLKTGSKKFKHKFNIVIGYEEGLANRFATFIESPYHISWIHCNPKFSNTDFKEFEETYLKSDKIICVSKSAQVSFNEIYPKFSSKTDVIYNLINEEQIKQLSNEGVSISNIINDEDFLIISVGRICKVKQFVEIPKIACKIKDRNINFKWLIIGDGENEYVNEIKEEIKNYGLSDYILMTGYQENPYPFFKRANLYVCTSLSESCPMVFLEANTLGTPVISTNFSSAKELINPDFGTITNLENMPIAIEDYIRGKSSSKEKENKKEFENFNNLLRLLQLK